jgi:hypothetical protein
MDVPKRVQECSERRAATPKRVVHTQEKEGGAENIKGRRQKGPEKRESGPQRGSASLASPAATSKQRQNTHDKSERKRERKRENERRKQEKEREK